MIARRLVSAPRHRSVQRVRCEVALLATLSLALLICPIASRATAVSVSPAGAPITRVAGESAAARRAARYLARAENTDGGFGEAPGTRSSALFSGWAALGLASHGVNIGLLRRAPSDSTALQYVESGAGATDSGSLERTILAVRAGGASADDVAGHDLTAELMRRFRKRGDVGGLVNLTAFGVLALCASGDATTATLQRRAAGWLARESNRNGGYGFAGRGSESDADDTGAVLEALHCAPRSGVIARARRRAVAYLRRDQDRDGGFPAAPGAGSNAQSTAWAIQGLIAAGVNPSRMRRDAHTPVGYLVGLVSRSGAVRYARGQTITPVWVTGEALMALDGTPLPLPGPRTAG